MAEKTASSRTVLPIPDRPPVGLITFDAKDPDTRFPPIEVLRPPKGAPNVVVILIDDVGFGATSAFGGPCQTPNLEKLANAGLKYNRMRTTALCSPTRQALLTGRNHHSVGLGGITEIEFTYDGGGLAKGGDVAPFVDGKKVREGRVEQTDPGVFSADETCDIGNESGSPVTTDYSARKFTGEVNWVGIDVDKAALDDDHLLAPEERLRLAMALQ